MDKIDTKRRSKNMEAIRSKDTEPELIVRKILYKNGFRYRVHKKDLPGTPDIYISKLNLAIFVHGCFWHRHDECVDGHIPKSNSDYWREKLERNVESDKRHLRDLKESGIKTLTFWACELQGSKFKTSENLILSKLNNI